MFHKICFAWAFGPKTRSPGMPPPESGMSQFYIDPKLLWRILAIALIQSIWGSAVTLTTSYLIPNWLSFWHNMKASEALATRMSESWIPAIVWMYRKNVKP